LCCAGRRCWIGLRRRLWLCGADRQWRARYLRGRPVRAFGLWRGSRLLLELLQSAGDFLFRAFSLLPGALQRGPLPVFEFLLQADALPLFFLPGAFLCGALFLQPSPLPLCAFLSKPFPFLAGAFLQRARQLFPGDPSLLRGLLALGDAVTLGRQLLLVPGLAFLFLAGAFLFLAGAFLFRAFLL
jgi:hypothetical protein